MGLYVLSSARTGTVNGPDRNADRPHFFAQSGTVIVPFRPRSGTKNGLYSQLAIHDASRMKRASVYTYSVTEPPGANIHRLREEAGMGLRELADACVPPITHTTLSRIERNHGYTQDTLERLAVALTRALGRKITVSDFFLPPAAAEMISEYKTLPPDAQQRVTDMVKDTAAAYKYRRRNTG
jgi:transcriptional regulator with XRE-family HTH domain